MSSWIRNSISIAALLSSTVMIAPLVAHAATVDETYYYTPDSIIDDLGTKALPAHFTVFKGNVYTTVRDGSVRFTDRPGCTPYCQFLPGPFNGFVLTYTGLSVTSVTLDPTSDIPGFTAADFSFTPNTITVNFQDLYQHYPEFVLLDVTTGGAVPEPAVWTLVLVGFAGLGISLRRRRRAVANTV